MTDRITAATAGLAPTLRLKSPGTRAASLHAAFHARAFLLRMINDTTCITKRNGMDKVTTYQAEYN